MCLRIGGVAAMVRTRRVLAVAVVVAVLVTGAACTGEERAGPGASGRPLTKVTIVTGFGAKGHEAYFWLGLEKGFFEDEGLNATIQKGAGTENNLKTLMGAKADAAVLDIAGAAVAYGGKVGAPIEQRVTGWAIVSALHQSSLSAIVSLPGSGINAPRDLAGKTIGYTPGGVNFTMFPAWAKLAGVDTSHITFVKMLPPQIVPALVSHQVDASVGVVVGGPEIRAAAGVDPVIMPYNDYWSDMYGNGLGVRRDFAGQHPDLVAAINRAVLRSLQYAVGHPQEAGAAMHRKFNAYSAQAAAEETRALAGYVRPPNGQPYGYIDDVKLKRSAALLFSQKLTGMDIQPWELVLSDQVPHNRSK